MDTGRQAGFRSVPMALSKCIYLKPPCVIKGTLLTGCAPLRELL